MRTLDQALAYDNDEVVSRFAADHGVSLVDAREIFVETKRWLWLCATTPVSIHLVGEARAIDSMWHTFIIFTREYADFCERYLGAFVHHRPRTIAEKEAWKDVSVRRASLKSAYETVAEAVGTATLEKWFVDFPARFPKVR